MDPDPGPLGGAAIQLLRRAAGSGFSEAPRAVRSVSLESLIFSSEIITVVGGLDQSGGDKSDLWHYTPEATGTGESSVGKRAAQAAWTLVDEGSGPSARYLHSAAADEGRLWIFGGQQDGGGGGRRSASRSGIDRAGWL